MLPLARLEGEQLSGAIYAYLFPRPENPNLGLIIGLTVESSNKNSFAYIHVFSKPLPGFISLVIDTFRLRQNFVSMIDYT
jgi:hypothetical protein